MLLISAGCKKESAVNPSDNNGGGNGPAAQLRAIRNLIILYLLPMMKPCFR